ncbi:zinc finger protein with KRAB and SCAN domains 8-like [Amphiprion ocellaris]|uniref:zinc finger protein with KRAB and SCAN domains 8-like n=1 Tax=Amphiprion ocellaris TaxID=80972 RepID=UPI0024114918|nr:zinc finger protein with KRAB and SCAN domains 8-like [Amphiprion ocellaris]
MCSVVGCDSFRRNAKRFKLPEDPEERLEWVQFVLEVNGQRLKESSWTDITICSEHFTTDCFVDQSLQLRSGSVPSLCVKSEEAQETAETTEVFPQDDQLRACDSLTSASEKSSICMSAPESPVPSDTSDSFSDYGSLLQKVVNIDMIREKAALLQMKGKYVVNENQLLQLFNSMCPFCGSKVNVEKTIHGVVIVLNQQCLSCDYRNQWKSLVGASVPAAEDKPPSGDTEVKSEMVSVDDNQSSITCVSESVEVTDKQSEPADEAEESSDEGGIDSDENWKPVIQRSLPNEVQSDSEEESESEYEDDDLSLFPQHSQLCTDCGKFFNKRKSHTCEHKIKPYSCYICGKRCVSEIALNSHSRIHDENYEHRCKYCHVTFKTKVAKMTHEQTHQTEGKPYKCPDCSETFASNKERTLHLEDHRGPRQLKCHICGIEFSRPTPLQRHLAVHTGAKPFKCSVCQRGFNQPSHLKSHMRLHTGERPYKCQHCDKCFNHNVSLKSHIQRYHTSSSGCEQNTCKVNKIVSDREKEQDKEKEVQKERVHVPKKRSSGRPIGRPKRNTPGEMQGSNKTAKVKARKRAHYSDKDCDDEPIKHDVTVEEEERREQATARKSKGRPKNSDCDSRKRQRRPRRIGQLKTLRKTLT